MSWLAVSDHSTQRFSRFGLGSDKSAAERVSDTPGEILARGTLMLEAAVTGDDKPETILGYSLDGPSGSRSLNIKSIPGGGVAFVQTLGKETRHTALQLGSERRLENLRISLAWDMSSGQLRFSIEQPGDFAPRFVCLEDPLPFYVQDLHRLVMARATFSASLVFVALSDEIEPLGPLPGLCGSTRVLGRGGYVPVGGLRRGDVIGRDGVPVLYTFKHSFPARGSFRPVRLRAPYFGLCRDTIVAPSQRLMISGSQVEYLFGQETVLVPAGHLVNGRSACFEPCGPVVEYVQLLMPQHEPLDVKGCAVESLYVGRLRRHRIELAFSILADLPRSGLPEHAEPTFPVLAGFEATTLASLRAA